MIETLPKAVAQKKMNVFGKKRLPFFFLIDYDQCSSVVMPLADINTSALQVVFPNFSRQKANQTPQKDFTFDAFPISYQRYRKSFDRVQHHLQAGNSYLTNLTFPTPIHTNLDMLEIFHLSSAPYKLWWRDQFVVFSPEIFVRINNGIISSFPMKGTLDANLPNAHQRLLADPKEKAEHATIVDLIRNDLSMVASRVRVKRYRYVDTLKTSRGPLLQTSSQISGQLDVNFHEQLGDLIFQLLPAGSISGAPKPKTLEIIREAEEYDRGFYTGIFGYFDGANLDSAVAIRFVEQQPAGLVYKSGGGITALSQPEEEYAELIQKVYLPILQSQHAYVDVTPAFGNH